MTILAPYREQRAELGKDPITWGVLRDGTATRSAIARQTMQRLTAAPWSAHTVGRQAVLCKGAALLLHKLSEFRKLRPSFHDLRRGAAVFLTQPVRIFTSCAFL